MMHLPTGKQQNSTTALVVVVHTTRDRAAPNLSTLNVIRGEYREHKLTKKKQRREAIYGSVEMGAKGLPFW